MARLFEIEYLGKSRVSSHFCRCDFCNRLTSLSTYTTRRFFKLLGLPFIPLNRTQIIEECPQCGKRGLTSAGKYEKERKRNLKKLKEGFSDPNNSHRCAHALHTLMTYGMESKFNEARNSCARHFETDPKVQLLIARGLSRFGNYNEAMIYCRKAIVLGAGDQAENLLKLNETLMAATGGKRPESTLKGSPAVAAYIPFFMLILLLVFGGAYGIQKTLNFSRVWIVNGTLQSYTFTIDDEPHALQAGEIKKINLPLGQHKLYMKRLGDHTFQNSDPIINQFLNKDLLIINPDQTALLALPPNNQEPEASYSYTKQVRIFRSIDTANKGVKKATEPPKSPDSILFYRPPSHQEMISLLQQLNPAAAIDYARNTLLLAPQSSETEQLLPVATRHMSDESVLQYLEPELSRVPTQLTWHLFYQDYMKANHPEVDLEKEYTQRCAENIEEPQSRYLLGRVANNRKLAHEFYAVSDQNFGMDGLGLYAIAQDYYCYGNFFEALPYAQQAFKHAPKNRDFRNLCEDILLGMRDYEALLELFSESDTSDLSSAILAQKKVRNLTGAGYHQEASEFVERTAEGNNVKRARLDAIRLYGIGNLSRYLLNLEEAGDPHAEFEQALHDQRFNDASNWLLKASAPSYIDHLVLYRATLRNDQTLAEDHLQRALNQLRSLSEAHRQMALLLSGNKSATLETLRSLKIDAQEKALLAVILAQQHPESDSGFIQLALLYNSTPTYPQHLIETWITESSN